MFLGYSNLYDLIPTRTFIRVLLYVNVYILRSIQVFGVIKPVVCLSIFKKNASIFPSAPFLPWKFGQPARLFT